ncbi:hypothetical protein AA0488_2510 [Kozakia baliensis NRIC 0488]|nr:hypothetical protein AA0488_2510 [Kozakia baliensis NRIC 0488]
MDRDKSNPPPDSPEYPSPPIDRPDVPPEGDDATGFPDEQERGDVPPTDKK